MRKTIIIIIITVLFILALTMNVRATTGAITIKTDKTEIAPGEEITITISASNIDGINTLRAEIGYEEDKLELIESNVTSSKWSNLGRASTGKIILEVICNSEETIKSDNIFTIKLKVKDTVKAGTTLKISAQDIKMGNDLAEENNISDKEVEITIKEKASETPANGGGTETPAQEQPQTQKPKALEQKNTIQESENESKGNLPKTGEATPIIITSAIIVLGVGCVSYLKYKKYRGI